MEKDPQDRLCRQIVEEAGDAIIFADRSGTIRLWNRGAGAIFGYAAEEAVGRSLDLIVPENLRSRHWEGYRRVMASGETEYADRLLAVPALGKGERRLSIEFTVTLVRSGGEIEGVAAIIREVTERRERERELQRRLAELERGVGD